MTDRNGKEIKIGDKAVLIGRGHDEFEGRVGEVRAIKNNWGWPNHPHPRVRISDGPEGDWNWSAWCKPSEISVV